MQSNSQLVELSGFEHLTSEDYLYSAETPMYILSRSRHKATLCVL
jgi:hypothetical protein